MGMANKLIKKLGIELPDKYQWVGSAIFGVLAFLFGTLLVWVVIALSKEAHADQVIKDGWFTSGSTFLIIERDTTPDMGRICRVTNGDMISNLGANITVFKEGNLEWVTQVTHHSCAFGRDARDYNAVGTGIVIRFSR